MQLNDPRLILMIKNSAAPQMDAASFHRLDQSAITSSTPH
jgi:hypothetical protein